MNIDNIKSYYICNENDGILRDKNTLEECTTNTGNGYKQVSINGKKYLAHRVIWFLYYGKWPKNQIDHINGDKKDNRISNLRDVNNRTNLQNMYKHRKGRLPGCYYHNTKKKWRAQIQIKGKRIHLGYFTTEKEAHNAYVSSIP